MHKILLNLQNVTFYNKTLTRLHRHKMTAFARCFGAVSILTSGSVVSRSVAVAMLASNMANTFAVCMTAKAGSTIKFSKVTSLSLDRDFDTVFNEHNVDDKLTLVVVKVSSGPQGPWMAVEKNECCLRDLNMRHLIFMVEEKQPVHPKPEQSAFHILMSSSRACAFPSKKKGLNAKDSRVERFKPPRF